MVEGGKDPDDVLREQGAAALRAQLFQTSPLVERLFERERLEAGSLATPEQRAALKARLRKAAGLIADAELSKEYKDFLIEKYEQLWPLHQPVKTYSGAARALAKRRWANRIPADTTLEAKAAAKRLAGSPSPFAAALADGLIRDPENIEAKIELLEAQGFCDPTLEALSKEIVRIRVSDEKLDPDALRYQLRARGFDQLMAHIEVIASTLKVPFLSADLPKAQARALWSLAFDVLVQIAALERAMESAKAEDEAHFDRQALWNLKIERDALRRNVTSGAIWESLRAASSGIIH